MAKVLFGQGVAEMRGSQAGQTYSRNRGGSYTRNRVTPLNPQSSRQQSVRSSMTELTTAWGVDLSQAQRDGWTAFAQAWPTTDVFGAVIVLTGLQMFVRQNMTLLQAGLPRIDDAPLNLDVQSLLTLSVTVAVGATTFDVDFTPTPLDAGSRFQLFVTPPIQPGISFVKNKLRLLITGVDATPSPIDAWADYVAMFGTPVAGQKIAIEGRVINAVNGTVSTALGASTIVVA
jgi:hypothetical protein